MCRWIDINGMERKGKLMTYLIQLLARIGQTPEFLATVATALIPIIVRLVTMILEKKTTDVRRITVKSSSG